MMQTHGTLVKAGFRTAHKGRSESRGWSSFQARRMRVTEGWKVQHPGQRAPMALLGLWAATCCRWCGFSLVLRRPSGGAWCLSQAGRPREALAAPQSLDAGIRARHSVPHPAGVLGHWGRSPGQRTPPSACLLPGPGWVTLGDGNSTLPS